MRITFDLPSALIKHAKIAALKRGITLHDLVAEGLRQVLSEKQPTVRHRMKLPKVRMAADAPLLRMSIEQLKDLEAEEDAEHLRAVYRRR